MWGDHRGRLTLPDLLFFLMSLAFLGALYPVFAEGLETRAPEMGIGAVYLYQLVVPLAALVLLSVIWIKATSGVR